MIGSAPDSRVARRKLKNREALVEAGYRIMSEKGIDAATMQEIADSADLGAGTVYSYFESKDDLVVAVLEKIMHRHAERIEAVTNAFDDPAQVYAFGIRALIRATIEDERWKRLLNRSEVIADALFRMHAPFAIRDIRNACRAGRFKVDNPELAFRMASHAIIGFGLAVVNGEMSAAGIDDAVVCLLCMNGVSQKVALEIARRPCPKLPPE